MNDGLSAGIFTSYYDHGENTICDYSPMNMAGANASVGGGLGLSYYYSSSIISQDRMQSEQYHHWTTNSFFIMSPKIGGSMGISKTYVPIIW
ncbi:MAG: hypothetical protein E7069_10485 [Bacteroidales bacterium]|jgi:hypothetical protein|nr:hypothetical protein [Bacteroidales bacterium]